MPTRVKPGSIREMGPDEIRQRVAELREELFNLRFRNTMKQLTKKQVQLNIEEIKRADLDAQLVAEHIAKQLEQRVSFRRAMKKAIASSMRAGAQGIRINCTGRLGGSEMARFETYREGRVPLHTLRADIDFARATANTAYGTCGVKVWMFHGEVLDKNAPTAAPAAR